MPARLPCRFFAVFVMLLLVYGCAPGPELPLPLSPSDLKPYLTATHPIPVVPTFPATNVPVPSATPFTYKVAPGDTMSGIALHFAVRLDDLLAANPGVIPEALSVGQALKIPASSAGSGNSQSAAPVPADIGAVNCYPSAAGLYCMALVHNPLPVPLENVMLLVSLLDHNGRALASQEAFLPLDILPSGSSLPAYAFFPAQAPGLQPVAQLISSIRLNRSDPRYLSVADRNVLVSIDWNGSSAQLQGQIVLGAPKKAAHSLWLAGVAFDQEGQIVGFRRWEWQGDLQPGGAQAFAFSVYSLGPPITRVDVIAEARP